MKTQIEKYTPGHTPNATAFMAARDVESHGFYLSPFLQPGFHVLDAGCGPGTITAGIAEAVFPGTVSAIDTAAPQLEYARRLTQGREIMNVHFANASAYELPFADETFDLVTSHALMEHLADPKKALREFHRVTRPGGFIALCSPDWDAFELTPLPAEVRRAIIAYRNLQEQNGGNTRAGAMLPDWITGTGFTLLASDEWFEEYADARTISRYLANQLEAAGATNHAAALAIWGTSPGARFRQSWKYATGVRADENRRRNRITE